MLKYNGRKLPDQLAVRIKKGWEPHAIEFLEFCDAIRRDPPEVQRIMMEFAPKYYQATTPEERQVIWEELVQVLFYNSNGVPSQGTPS